MISITEGKKLQAERKKRGWTIVDVARMTRRTTTDVSRVENPKGLEETRYAMRRLYGMGQYKKEVRG